MFSLSSVGSGSGPASNGMARGRQIAASAMDAPCAMDLFDALAILLHVVRCSLPQYHTAAGASGSVAVCSADNHHTGIVASRSLCTRNAAGRLAEHAEAVGGVQSAAGSRLQLLYNGEVLPAGRALSSFGIPHGAVLDLVSAPCLAACPPAAISPSSLHRSGWCCPKDATATIHV